MTKLVCQYKIIQSFDPCVPINCKRFSRIRNPKCRYPIGKSCNKRCNVSFDIFAVLDPEKSKSDNTVLSFQETNLIVRFICTIAIQLDKFNIQKYPGLNTVWRICTIYRSFNSRSSFSEDFFINFAQCAATCEKDLIQLDDNSFLNFFPSRRFDGILSDNARTSANSSRQAIFIFRNLSVTNAIFLLTKIKSLFQFRVIVTQAAIFFTSIDAITFETSSNISTSGVDRKSWLVDDMEWVSAKCLVNTATTSPFFICTTRTEFSRLISTGPTLSIISMPFTVTVPLKVAFQLTLEQEAEGFSVSL